MITAPWTKGLTLGKAFVILQAVSTRSQTFRSWGS